MASTLDLHSSNSVSTTDISTAIILYYFYVIFFGNCARAVPFLQDKLKNMLINLESNFSLYISALLRDINMNKEKKINKVLILKHNLV